MTRWVEAYCKRCLRWRECRLFFGSPLCSPCYRHLKWLKDQHQ